MRVSIIVPVFNASKHIDGLLRNILAQSFRDFEVLFMDGGSTDSTPDLIKHYRSSDVRIRFVSEKDNGIYDAMNKGIEQAKGEWIYFMGSDDRLYDDHVLEKIASFLNGENDLVYGNVQWVPDNQTEAGEVTPRLLFDRNINHQRIFYRKILFHQNGGYQLRYRVAADHELNIRFFCHEAIKKKYIPVMIANYHSGGFSAHQLDEVFWKDWKPIFKKNFAQYLPKQAMYQKLGWYCRYQLEHKNYRKAFVLFWDVLLHTFSPGFVKLTFAQIFQSNKVHAR